MKKFILLFCLILLINNVSAITQIPNANTTDIFHYNNNSNIDTIYQLNNTDSLYKLNIIFDAFGYPFSNTYNLKDNHNNTLSIVFTYWKIYQLPFNSIHRNVSVYYNNQPLKLVQKTFFSKNITAFEIEDSDNQYNVLANKDNLINIITFEPSKITIDSNIFNQIIIITNVKNTYGYLSNPIFISKIELPSNDIKRFEIQEINIDYRDIGISKLQYEIDKSYNDLSAPFKFIFIIFKALLVVIKTITLGYVISDIDFYQYQIWFIVPLQYINLLVLIFFNVLKFITLMGITWTFLFIESVIFIVNWIRYRDIIDTITNTFQDSINVWNIILIKPLNWIFTKLLLFWTGK